MNQSIRPLPSAPIKGKGVVEGPSLLPIEAAAADSVASDFGNLLDSELKDSVPEPQTEPSVEPWTIFGYALPIIEPIPQLVVATATGGNVPVAQPLDQTTSPESALPTNEAKTPDTLPSEVLNEPRPTLASLIDGLKPVQQNIPVTPLSQPPQKEQIAGKPVQSAKNSNGIPAAQVPPMLFASDKQEDSALRQTIPLSVDNSDLGGFEAEIRSVSPRNSAPERDLGLADFSPVESIKPEWSSFESVSETSDLQPVHQVESVEIAQAIRSHVELLKTSSHDKIDVVLRPDGQTELRLHVEKVNGQILIQARCDRGDFARLDANWTAVQQSLAQQGIRVESLQNNAAFHQPQQNWDNSNTDSQQNFTSRREHESNFTEQELSVPKSSKQPAANNGPARGWQSWA